MVEYVPAYGGYWRGSVPGVVAQEILRGTWVPLIEIPEDEILMLDVQVKRVV